MRLASASYETWKSPGAEELNKSVTAIRLTMQSSVLRA
jgi:hypothetical protein